MSIYEIVSGPKLVDRKAMQEEVEKLKQAVLSGEVQDKVLSNALRKEMNNNSEYDGEWTLGHSQYLNSIIDKMDLSSGVNLINASVGSGKTSHFINTPSEYEKEQGVKPTAKEGYIVLVPLTSIRLQFEGDNDVFKSGICTWNQVEAINRSSNNEFFADKTLVIDEVHGFFLDYKYKADVINKLIKSFSIFKSVIMMSGTATQNDFSGIVFNKMYKVYKPSQARKVLNTVVGTKIKDLVLNHLNTSTRKIIVLYNDKVKCETLNQMCVRSGLEVNRNMKNNQDVIDLFVNGQMDFDILYGTYSMVEGLSIENVLDEVDIIIVGNEHPARIEQFTNRFRKISKLKNVTYYIERREVQEVAIYNRDGVIKDATIMKELLQLTYEALSTDEAKYSFTSQYRSEMYGNMVYFHNGKFEVSYSGIDYDYSEHKKREYANDFSLLKIELEKYDFIVNPIRFADGDGDNEAVISNTAKKLKEAAQAAEEAIIREYMADAISGNVKPVEDATELYNAVDKMVENIMNRGLVPSDFNALMEGFIKDRSFFYHAHLDASYHPTGSTIRELIINQIGGKTRLDSFDKRDIADAVIHKVLQEYFTGRQDLMLKHSEWSKCVVVQNGTLVSSSEKAATNILSRYIKLDKSKPVKVNGILVRMSEVLHHSLTGLHFTKPAFNQPIDMTVQQAEANQTLSSLKERLSQLRMG